MIKLNKKALRPVMTIFFGAIFAASAFIFNINTAQMQAGANTVAFDRYDDATNSSKVFVMNADGTNVTELANGYDPSWSSNGAKIAYVDGDNEQFDIWTMNADGSEKTRLTQNYRSYAPAWSPDGSRIAFVSDHENGYHVYVINADGSNQQRLNVTASEVYAEYAPAWSPDGAKVIFLGAKVVNGLGREDYYQANADGSGATTQLTFLNALLERLPAAVAPDGSRLVFEYQHDLQAALTNGSNQLVNLSGNGDGTDEEADYAPNGSKIIFRRGEYLSVMDADGSNVVNLDVVGSHPDWNPTAVLQNPTPTPTPTATPQISANLAVQANVSAQNATVGQQLTYTISVGNSGADAATGVVLTDAFPSSLTLVSIQSSQGSCALVNGQINCQLGTLGVNASANITMAANVNAAGFISNQFAASAIESDPDTVNNSATVNVTATASCAQSVTTPIEITRSQWRRDERSGQDELILTIRNRADHAVDPRLIFVFDNLPQGITVDPSVVAGYTQCSAPIGSPYVVAYAPNKQEWKPMQTVSVRVLFNNPQRGGIPFTWRLYSGTVNP